MNSKMETKVWNWIYNSAGYHPDDLMIDWDSIEAVKQSLRDQDIELDGFPTDDKPLYSHMEYCKAVAECSSLTDKTFALGMSIGSSLIKELWENCECPYMPQNEEILLAEVKNAGYTLSLNA